MCQRGLGQHRIWRGSSRPSHWRSLVKLDACSFSKSRSLPGSSPWCGTLSGLLVQSRKPLHYWLKASAFADVTGSCCARCSPTANCYVKNDGAFDFSGSVTVESVEYSTAKTSIVLTQQLHLAAGAQTMQWLSASMFPAAETHGLILTIYNNDSARSVHSRNELILTPPVNLTLPPVQVSATVAPAPSADNSVEITVRSVGGAAVYVVLTTKAQVSCVRRLATFVLRFCLVRVRF